MLSVPFALTGGCGSCTSWVSNLSVAVAVGFIALAGVAAETGVVMLIYLDHAFTEMVDAAAGEGHRSRNEISTQRSWKARSSASRPEDDDSAAIMAGLLPICGARYRLGGDQRIAVPMVGA